MNREFLVGDYLFSNKQDADRAKEERNKILKLEEKLPGADFETKYKLYHKCIENRTFVTPIGFEFMKRLKRGLEKSPEYEDTIVPIPMFTSFEHSSMTNFEKRAEREAMEEEKRREIKTQKDVERWKISVILNVVLIAVIIAMFIITMNSDAPNIVNYKRVLTNQYAQWEQDLTQREDALKKKELEFSEKK